MTVPEALWTHAIRVDGSERDHSHVVEITDRVDLSAWAERSRLIARRTQLKDGDQQSFADHDGCRLSVLLTDQSAVGSKPPGWYETSGRANSKRYWDGADWTGDYAPADIAPPVTSGAAIAAFITSLVGLWIAGIPLGIHAQRAIDSSNGSMIGRGFATAGVVIGILGAIGAVVLVAVLVHHANHPGCTYTYQATGACVPGT